MNLRVSIACLAGVFLFGCAEKNTAVPAPSASTSASSAPVKLSVQRKTTPAALRAADETACSAGKVDACRRMADRYRGYGHPAGCGIEHSLPETAYGRTMEPMHVRIKRAMKDEKEDAKSFLAWIGKACDLGDSDACIIEGAVRAKRQPSSTFDIEYGATRSDPNASALIGFHALWQPDNHEKFLAKRKDCLLSATSSCWDLSKLLVNRPKEELRPELGPDLMAKLQAIGDRTLDFGAVLMMLDKYGYTPEALAPLLAHSSKTLVQACVEGACVCGEAAQSLPLEDPRVPDLARWGCENGEATGCHMLAKLHEEGRGVEKDEVFARSLYEIACPPAHARSASAEEEYAPASCSRLAEMAEGGVMPPKNRDRAVYYAEFACRNPGSERDHSFCVKLAKYWTTSVLSQTCDYSSDYCKNSARQAAELFYSPENGVGEAKECQRPSVKALCDALEPDVVAMKKPAGKKKK